MDFSVVLQHNIYAFRNSISIEKTVQTKELPGKLIAKTVLARNKSFNLKNDWGRKENLEQKSPHH